MKQSELEEGYSKVWEEDRTEDLDDRVTHFDHNAEYMESSEADSDQDTEEEDKHSDHDIL